MDSLSFVIYGNTRPNAMGFPIGKIRIGIFSIEMRNAMFGIWVVFSWIFVQIQNENIIDFAMLLVNDNVFYFFFFSNWNIYSFIQKYNSQNQPHKMCGCASQCVKNNNALKSPKIAYIQTSHLVFCMFIQNVKTRNEFTTVVMIRASRIYTTDDIETLTEKVVFSHLCAK